MMDSGETPDVFQMARTIATARIIMPRSMVRLSAGRMSFSHIEQAVMFLAGANSIFTGDKLLTTANPAFDEDMVRARAHPAHFASLARPPFAPSLTDPARPASVSLQQMFEDLGMRGKKAFTSPLIDEKAADATYVIPPAEVQQQQARQ